MRNATQSNANYQNAEQSTELHKNAMKSDEFHVVSSNLSEDRIPVGPKTEAYTETLDRGVKYFSDGGVMRSRTTVWRMCQKDKNGISQLDCILDPQTRMIFVTKESLEIARGDLIDEQHKKGFRKDYQMLPKTGDSGSDFTPEDRNEYNELQKKHEKLQREYQDLIKDKARSDGRLDVYEKNWKDLVENMVPSIVKAVAQEQSKLLSASNEPVAEKKIFVPYESRDENKTSE